jgi:hypothetical protein
MRTLKGIKEIKTIKIPVRIRFHTKDGHYIYMSATKIVKVD